MDSLLSDVITSLVTAVAMDMDGYTSSTTNDDSYLATTQDSDPDQWTITATPEHAARHSATAFPTVTDMMTSATDLMTSEKSTDPGYTGAAVALLHEATTMTVFYGMALAMLIFLGVIGNSLIIAAFFTTTRLKVVGAEFIMNLAVADLMVVSIGQPMCLLGAIKGQEYFDARPVLCEFIGCVCLTACLVAFFSLVAVSVNRFFFICWNDHYERLYTKRNVLIMIAIIWIIGFALDAPHFIGLGGHYFDEKNHQCAWNRDASTLYTVVCCAIILLSLAFLILIYVVIFLKVRKVQRTIAHGNERRTTTQVTSATGTAAAQRRSSHSTTSSSSILSAWKTCKTLIIVVVAYNIFWLPYCVVVLLDVTYDTPVWAHLWSTLLAHAHSSVSFIIYGVMSGRYSKAYSRMLGCVKLFKWIDYTSHVHGASEVEQVDAAAKGRSMYGDTPSSPHPARAGARRSNIANR